MTGAQLKKIKEADTARSQHTLVDIYLRTASFEQNILGYYSGTTQESETNDTSFERPIIELLENVMKEGVAVS